MDNQETKSAFIKACRSKKISLPVTQQVIRRIWSLSMKELKSIEAKTSEIEGLLTPEEQDLLFQIKLRTMPDYFAGLDESRVEKLCWKVFQGHRLEYLTPPDQAQSSPSNSSLPKSA